MFYNEEPVLGNDQCCDSIKSLKCSKLLGHGVKHGCRTIDSCKHNRSIIQIMLYFCCIEYLNPFSDFTSIRLFHFLIQMISISSYISSRNNDRLIIVVTQRLAEQCKQNESGM